MAQGSKHIPTEETRKLVEELSGYGLPHENICSLVGGINRETLSIHYRDELDKGKAKANAQVGKSLFQRALNDESPTAAIWWSKSQMRWKETQVQEQIVTQKKTLDDFYVDNE